MPVLFELWNSVVEFVASPRGPFQQRSKVGKHEEIVQLGMGLKKDQRVHPVYIVAM